MSMMTVPNLPAGWSLPSELNTARGRNFAARRLRGGMRGLSALRGVGDCCSDTCSDMSCVTSPSSVTGSPTINVTPVTTPVTTPAPTGPTASDLATAAASDASSGLTPCLSYDSSGVCSSWVASPPAYSAPAGYPTSAPLGTSPAAPAGYQWVQAANGAALSLAKVLAISQGGTVMQLPNGQQIITGAAGTSALASTALSGTLGSMLPLLLLAGGAVLLFSFARR
jgi:hypothetical protein